MRSLSLTSNPNLNFFNLYSTIMKPNLNFILVNWFLIEKLILSCISSKCLYCALTGPLRWEQALRSWAAVLALDAYSSHNPFRSWPAGGVIFFFVSFSTCRLKQAIPGLPIVWLLCGVAVPRGKTGGVLFLWRVFFSFKVFTVDELMITI